ncbi:hypothetical protein [Leptospira noguchii]|uniref:Uncharacterized protein n=1 Tax=Leptospira noguchii str. 2001034031 TaxID=1193053 RepID=M6Y295_9LEPT|nr:hypothetical protein [Leptospira noguchii]EMO88437.1 hypothetical protein LEP1GSC024_1435 [Leptospira noguchii str. 2001034031]
MKKLVILALVIELMISINNCTSVQGTNGIAGAKLSSFLDIRALNRKDYKVIGSVKGESSYTRTRYLIPLYPFVTYNFGTPGLTAKKDSGSISGYPVFPTPTSPLDYAKDQAIYNALEKLDGADAILQPRFKTKCEEFSFPLFYNEEKCTVNVIGKAISINEG